MNAEHRPTLASRAARRWVRIYTAHLDATQRDARRDEIASDLWEHEAYAQRIGLGSVRINAQVLRRLLVGIPADLSWRRETRDATPALAGPAPVPTAASPSRWVCRVRGHKYVVKRLPNKLDDGGIYCVCERCDHERIPSGTPPRHWTSGLGPG